MEIVILVNWAKPPVTIAKGQVTISGKNAEGQISGGNFAIGGNRKPPNPVTWTVTTYQEADMKGGNTPYSTTIAQNMSGSFPPSMSMVKPDTWKMILSQTANLSFMWPADAGAGDKVTLIFPSFKPVLK